MLYRRTKVPPAGGAGLVWRSVNILHKHLKLHTKCQYSMMIVLIRFQDCAMSVACVTVVQTPWPTLVMPLLEGGPLGWVNGC